MDSAARNTKRSSQILDGDGYKFGGDTGEILNSQGKGSSLTRCPFHKFTASQAAARLYGLGG